MQRYVALQRRMGTNEPQEQKGTNIFNGQGKVWGCWRKHDRSQNKLAKNRTEVAQEL
jgi:hypothetical protein